MGFILKTSYDALSEGAALMQAGVNSGAGGTRDPRFYFHLGDALYRLGRDKEARQVGG